LKILDGNFLKIIQKMRYLCQNKIIFSTRIVKVRHHINKRILISAALLKFYWIPDLKQIILRRLENLNKIQTLLAS